MNRIRFKLETFNFDKTLKILTRNCLLQKSGKLIEIFGIINNIDEFVCLEMTDKGNTYPYSIKIKMKNFHENNK